MQQFLSFTASGLTSASVYAIVASGLVLTFATTGTFNFAHGALAMVGAFTYWQLQVAWGWPVPVALAVTVGVVGPILGVLVARLMQGLAGTTDTVRLVASLGLLLGLLGAAQYVWDPAESRTLAPFSDGGTVTVLDVRITHHQLLTMAVAVAVAGGLWYLLRRTRTGVAMRAAVDDPTLATLNGARPRRSAALAWTLGSVLAAVAGILVAPTTKLNALNLALLIVNAYGAAAFGRLRSLPMTFVGAIVLGLSRDYTIWLRSRLDPAVAPYLGGLSNAVPAVVLFVVLVAMPAARLRTAPPRPRERTQGASWAGGLRLGAAAVAGTALLASISGTAALLGAGQVWGIAIIGLSMVPLIGYAGQMSLAQLSFAGVGAVAYAHLGWDSPGALLWAALWAGGAGLLAALPAVRLAGIYLALATGAFALLLEQWLFLLPRISVLGHDFEVFSGGNLPADRPQVAGLDLGGDAAYFVYSAVVFAVMVLAVVAVRRSMFGLRLIAARDAPAAIATTGASAVRLKLVVFAGSAAMAGVGGAVLAGARQSVTADGFGLFAGLPILLVMVVAGISSPGASVAAGLFLAGTELFAGLPLGPFRPLVEGGGVVQSILIGAVAVALSRHPDGLVPLARVKLAALRGAGGGVRGRAPDGRGAPEAGAAPAYAPELIGLGRPADPEAIAWLDARLGLPPTAPGGARA